MIRMLPIVDALRNTSHMADRRKELEEAGYDDKSGRAVESITRMADKVSMALDDVEHHHRNMQKELQGSRSFMSTASFKELNNLAVALGKDLKTMKHRLDNV